MVLWWKRQTHRVFIPKIHGSIPCSITKRIAWSTMAERFDCLFRSTLAEKTDYVLRKPPSIKITGRYVCIRRLANTVGQTARQVHRVSVVLNGSPMDMVKGTGRIPTQLRGWWSAAGGNEQIHIFTVYRHGRSANAGHCASRCGVVSCMAV